ncbi:unnamed protein product [Hymenolepis diminuta]|uniref:Uncharacterized protein n=1 Tax=Hymenolepis diminuta TaxID=6216 RepID=A0A564YCT5_HYMDI|nr:unnamed protein product [Hymenolepis diminuta]VUZ44863.1 unnamed protein product [Hymenolepis diminuta]VUZ44865.1 unnamed protein product [Hymenolepis diminuta]
MRFLLFPFFLLPLCDVSMGILLPIFTPLHILLRNAPWSRHLTHHRFNFSRDISRSDFWSRSTHCLLIPSFVPQVAHITFVRTTSDNVSDRHKAGMPFGVHGKWKHSSTQSHKKSD